MGNITLTASMRNNLLSLKNTSSLMDLTQNRLSTGNKVNSAIDNPSSYYTAQSLNNRANDLSALLDSMGLAISTIKAATTTLDTGAEMLQQAAAVATQTLETAKPIIARVNTEQELLAAVNSGQKGFIVLENDITMSDNQNIVLHDGQSLVGRGFIEKTSEKTSIKFNVDIDNYDFEDSSLCLATNSILSNLDIKANMKCGNIEPNVGLIMAEGKNNVKIQNININLNVDEPSRHCDAALFFHNSQAVLTGDINIKVNGTRTRALHVYNASDVKIEKAKLNIYNNGKDTRGIVVAYEKASLNIENSSKVNIWDNGIMGYGLHNYDASTFVSDSKLNIISTNVGILNQIGSCFEAGENSYVNIYSNIDSVLNYGEQDTLILKSSSNLFLESENSTIIANGDNGYIDIVKGAKINLKDANGNYSFNTIDYQATNDITLHSSNFASVTGAAQNSPIESPDWEAIKNEIANPTDTEIIVNNIDGLEEFSNILTQYNNLMDDGSYKGINLLKNEELNVRFNEDRSSSLDVKGKDMSTDTLGLKTNSWLTADDVVKSIEEIASAVRQIRNYNTELGNNYNIITNRQEFTERLINVLTEGADKLTLADMNEESANMLALQTRQQLAINSLSLASQASQSVLKLF